MWGESGFEKRFNAHKCHFGLPLFEKDCEICSYFLLDMRMKVAALGVFFVFKYPFYKVCEMILPWYFVSGKKSAALSAKVYKRRKFISTV